MTPARLSLITRLATNLATARAQHRGRTVPAITSFSAHRLMPPPCVETDASDFGVRCANTGGSHDLSQPSSNSGEIPNDDLASWPTRSPVRTGAPSWDGRAIVAGDADGFRTEYTIADPQEYPVLVFSSPPDTRDVPDEDFPPERTQFERDMWRDKGC